MMAVITRQLKQDAARMSLQQLSASTPQVRFANEEEKKLSDYKTYGMQKTRLWHCEPRRTTQR